MTVHILYTGAHDEENKKRQYTNFLGNHVEVAIFDILKRMNLNDGTERKGGRENRKTTSNTDCQARQHVRGDSIAETGK